MNLIYPITFLVIFILGIFLGVKCFIRSKIIFCGKEMKPIKIIGNAALAGMSASLLFFGGVYFFFSIFDQSFQYQIKDLLTSFALFLVLVGLLTFAGSLWQYFQVGKFRDEFLELLNRRKNNHTPKK